MKKFNLANEEATKDLGKIIADEISNINKESIEIHLEGELAEQNFPDKIYNCKLGMGLA